LPPGRVNRTLGITPLISEARQRGLGNPQSAVGAHLCRVFLRRGVQESGKPQERDAIRKKLCTERGIKKKVVEIVL